jgi:hypothetical protein
LQVNQPHVLTLARLAGKGYFRASISRPADLIEQIRAIAWLWFGIDPLLIGALILTWPGSCPRLERQGNKPACVRDDYP